MKKIFLTGFLLGIFPAFVFAGQMAPNLPDEVNCTSTVTGSNTILYLYQAPYSVNGNYYYAASSLAGSGVLAYYNSSGVYQGGGNVSGCPANVNGSSTASYASFSGSTITFNNSTTTLQLIGLAPTSTIAVNLGSTTVQAGISTQETLFIFSIILFIAGFFFFEYFLRITKGRYDV